LYNESSNELEVALVRGISHRVKQYVEVIAKHEEDGTVLPLTVCWDDGRKFKIDSVLDRRQAAALKTGGCGIRFRIRIGKAETFLFYEAPRWFVEAIVRE